MALIQSGVSGSTLMTVDPTFTAARVALRPIEQVGSYSVGALTGNFAGAGANTPFFSMRFVAGSAGQSQIAIIRRIVVSFVQTTGFTTAQQVAFGLYFARSFTASDSGGTQINMAGNNQKLRTAYPTSQFATGGDIRIATTAALSAGARTIDTQALAVQNGWCGTTLTTTGVVQPAQIALYEARPGETPMVLANNEGLVLNNLIALGAGGVLTLAVSIDWNESSSTAALSY